MKYIKMVRTFDGQLHISKEEAIRYLDVMYTNRMSTFAAALIDHSFGNYQKTKEWLDENLDIFVTLKEIKDDMSMEEDQNVSTNF